MKLSLALVSCLLVAGCAGPAGMSVPPPSPPAAPRDARTTEFDRALASLVAHDTAHDWSDASCREVASRFLAIGTPPALFDAAIAHQRCGHVDDAIPLLEKAVTEGKFQDAPALVALARLQMVKGGPTPEAKLNIQRALAIDDASLPAYDQLAQWYLKAKRLDLAALVCSQAMKRNASYAPIHLTSGLIENEQGHVNAALREFSLARKLDPSLFDAHLAYALVNLGFRGFDQAREALEQAIRLRPNDYDAHLGMALALRGPLIGDEPDIESRIAAVQSELDAAKKIDPKRPDAFFNEGILIQEYRTKTQANVEATKANLRLASRTFETFVAMAAGAPRYEVSVKRARGRMADIEATLAFLSQ